MSAGEHRERCPQKFRQRPRHRIDRQEIVTFAPEHQCRDAAGAKSFPEVRGLLWIEVSGGADQA
jgi:hypothetical protein